jgi:hypothetical protein
MATSPAVQNDTELENYLLKLLHQRAIAQGFQFPSTFIEERVRNTGPPWLHRAAVLGCVDNYLRSGNRFDYLQVMLRPETERAPVDRQPVPGEERTG